MTGLLTGDCHINGHLFKEGTIVIPECGICKQAIETASHVPCDCEALVELIFRRLGQHFKKAGALRTSPSAGYCTFTQSAGLLNA